MTIFQELNVATNNIKRLLLNLSPGNSPEETLFIDRAYTTMEELEENIKHIKEARA
jgi:hypothetical protein